MLVGGEEWTMLAMEDTEEDRLERGLQMLTPVRDNDADEVVARW